MSDELSKFYTIDPIDLSALKCFQLYSSIKVNFNNIKYDFHNDGICNNHNEFTFNKRHDQFWFKKASDKFMYQSRFIPLLVSNFYYNKDFWIGSFLTKEALTNALAFKKYQNNLYSSFQSDVQKLAFKMKFKCLEELYHPVYHTHYFELDNKKLFHPITSAILNHMFYDKTTEWNNSVYNAQSIYLKKLLKFVIPELDVIKAETILDNIIWR